jgi:HlyD family secretion protein
MAKSKKRRKTVVFGLIGVVLAGLAAVAAFKKREVVFTVQTESVARRTITELVVANGKIQPVLQVKISAEVSGEIIELPVKEGQKVNKGDLLVKIKPEFYVAALNQADASYKASLAGKATAEANLRKTTAEFKRYQEMFAQKLVSPSGFEEAQAANEVAAAQLDSSVHQVEMSKASVDSARDSLDKTTIVAPLAGTISKLNSRLGERVLGTIQNLGTEIMTIADLNEMETRVDIGENDVVLLSPGQKARLEVDAFKNRKFIGTVTEIANSSKDSGQLASSGNSQEATKFEVRIRIDEKEAFRPGMSVTAEIETRSRTNVLAVPFASVTKRLPKEDKSPLGQNGSSRTNSTGSAGNAFTAAANASEMTGTNVAKADKKKDTPKPIEVVFLKEGDHVKMVPVKIGIADDDFWEITEGLTEGSEVISGSSKAINRDLEDGKKIKKGAAEITKEGERKRE